MGNSVWNIHNSTRPLGVCVFKSINKLIQAFVIRLTMALAYFLYIACSTLGKGCTKKKWTRFRAYNSRCRGARVKR